MFDVNVGQTLKVSYAREGKHQDGTPYAVICCYERDNQPEGIDNPSKSCDSIKIWLDKLPKGITDGCLIQIKSILGFRKVSERNVFNNKEVWRTAINLKGELKLVKEEN